MEEYNNLEDIFIEPEEIFKRLIDNMRKYHPSNDFSLVERAYVLAVEAHKDQKRKSGEPYVIHPLEVAVILSELEMDRETITAGILHDIIEDTDYTHQDISTLFSEEIAQLVMGVTKLEKLGNYEGAFRSKDKPEGKNEKEKNEKEEQKAENYRKMFLAMSNDIRVIIIKIADRLHNLRTLKYMRLEKQKEIAQESIDIYAPLAHRLGITKIRYELEDLSFRYIHPEEYFELKERIQRKQSEREDWLNELIAQLKECFNAAGMYEYKYMENFRNHESKKQLQDLIKRISFAIRRRQASDHRLKRELVSPNIKGYYVEGRPKHFFSIHKKMVNQGKSLDQIYDLFAVRVIMDSVKDCYEILGLIHEKYTPVPDRLKDYIALPKSNVYRSIHSTLIGPWGEPFEIQIRTWEMHREAEYGIAAHWRYKEGKAGEEGDDAGEKKLTWLRQILEYQREMSDNREYLDSLKEDLNVYKDNVHIFTPKGEVKILPIGSNPIDFAYAIHSAVGNRMIGVKVFGKIVPYDYELKNGDRVEILTSQNAKPHRDWVKLARTSQARNKINQWFRLQNRDENILAGKSLLEKGAKKKSLTLNELMTAEGVKAVLDKFSLLDWESICAAVGHGGIKEGQVINRLYDEYILEKGKLLEAKTLDEIQEELADKAISAKIPKHGIFIDGVGDTSVRYSKCCNPVPGDEVVAFITRGRGVSLHRTDCVNIINLDEMEAKRLIPAHWRLPEKGGSLTYRTELDIKGESYGEYFSDICRAINDDKITLLQIAAKKEGDIDHMQIAIMVTSKEQLERLQDKLMKVGRTISVDRIST